MSREKYTHVQVLLPEIRAMEAAGKTKREIAEHFGLRDNWLRLPAGFFAGAIATKIEAW